MDATPGASSPKRRRVDENPGDSFAEQVPLSDLKHSQEFWYGDGSVVLVCEDTGFRVHKSTMSTHSSVFRDLFSQGHMLADEKVDDCDVVRLPDRAYDFERLLRALYSRSYMRETSKVDLFELKCILTVATKYMFQEIRQEVVAHLTQFFPDSPGHYRNARRQKLVEGRVDSIIGISIGEECNVPVILPAAYYASTFIPVERILDEAIMPDGSSLRLSPSAQRTAIVFREKFARIKEANLRFTLEYHPSLKCNSGRECFRAAYMAELAYRSPNYDIFAEWELSETILEERKISVCESCLGELETNEDMYKETMWDQLAALCGLGHWSEVTKDQITADAE